MKRVEKGRGLHLVIGALVAASFAGCSRAEANGAASEVEDQGVPLAVEVAEARLLEQPLTLSLDGTLVADEDSQVTPLVQGRVVEVFVERGSHVEEGDPLMRLRDVDYRLQARAARAQLQRAEAMLGMEGGGRPPAPEETAEVRAAAADMALAEANLTRTEELARRGVLSQQALDQSRAAAAAARERHASALNGTRASIATLEGARASLAQAATAAGDATVRAPFAGEIADRMVAVGEFVSPQTPLVTLVRTDPLRIEVVVPQQHLLAVRPGQAVETRVDAAPDRAFEGTVRYVSAAVDRTSRGLTVEAVVPNPDGLLRPGLFATARLRTGGTREVAVVPDDAVLTRAGVDRVFVLVEGRIEERVVSVADRREDEAVIEDGLAPGETVATGGLERLRDGLSVTLAPASASTEPN